MKKYLKSKEHKVKRQHIAIIPARKNSVGYKKKNRKFFIFTKKFLNQIKWFDKIYISTDDDWFRNFCNEGSFEFVKRSKELSGHKVSIKKVMQDVVKKKKIMPRDIIWLIYIPLLPKSKRLYETTKKIIEKRHIKSVCGFKKVKTHPYLTWFKKKNKIYQYSKNDIYRRQDLPPAYEHNHTVCAFNCSELMKLNNELINCNTRPITINNNFYEID